MEQRKISKRSERSGSMLETFVFLNIARCNLRSPHILPGVDLTISKHYRDNPGGPYH